MTAFSLLSAINMCLSITLFVVATSKLRDIKDIATSQIVAPASVIAVALMGLHMIGNLGHDKLGPESVIDAAWRVVDMITLLLIIRLIKIIKD